MCCPFGFSRQCMMVSESSANQLRRSSVDHTPTLLSQPARLVVELTSGLTVTTVWHSCPAALSAPNRCHGRAGSMPSSAASPWYWATVNSDPWFCGWPSIGNPPPLMV